MDEKIATDSINHRCCLGYYYDSDDSFFFYQISYSNWRFYTNKIDTNTNRYIFIDLSYSIGLCLVAAFSYGILIWLNQMRNIDWRIAYSKHFLIASFNSTISKNNKHTTSNKFLLVCLFSNKHSTSNLQAAANWWLPWIGISCVRIHERNGESPRSVLCC